MNRCIWRLEKELWNTGVQSVLFLLDIYAYWHIQVHLGLKVAKVKYSIKIGIFQSMHISGGPHLSYIREVEIKQTQKFSLICTMESKFSLAFVVFLSNI